MFQNNYVYMYGLTDLSQSYIDMIGSLRLVSINTLQDQSTWEIKPTHAGFDIAE